MNFSYQILDFSDSTSESHPFLEHYVILNIIILIMIILNDWTTYCPEKLWVRWNFRMSDHPEIHLFAQL